MKAISFGRLNLHTTYNEHFRLRIFRLQENQDVFEQKNKKQKARVLAKRLLGLYLDLLLLFH